MSTELFFRNVCEKLREYTSTPVMLGAPVDKTRGIFVWPWRIAENKLLHKQTSAPLSAGYELNSFSLNVHFAVIPNPAFTEEGISLVETVYQLIFDVPTVEIDNGQAHLIVEDISLDQLASLFLSAGLPISPCVCVRSTIVFSGLDSPISPVISSDVE